MKKLKIKIKEAKDAEKSKSSTQGLFSDFIDPLGFLPNSENTPEPEKKTSKPATTGTINPHCRCVDPSESSLSISKIKMLLNKFYSSNSKFEQLKVDNNCDQKTRRAIMNFQAATGAEQDGCVGDETEGKMVEAGLLAKLTIPRSSSASTYQSSPSSAEKEEDSQIKTSDFKPSQIHNYKPDGVTISIKSDVAGYKPSPRLKKPNHHGYGRDTATHGNTSNDSYFINGKDFAKLLSGVKGISVIPKPGRQHGNQALAKIIIAAATAVYAAVPKDDGLAGVADVSLSRCVNKKEMRKNSNVPCIQGGWGPMLGRHRWGHQSGLEVDIGYYKKKGNNYWYNAKANKAIFDYERNCIFTEQLLSSKQIEMVMVGPAIKQMMQSWVRKDPQRVEKFPNILSSEKLIPDTGKGGHDNHYHIRAEFPENSFKSMKQFKISIQRSKSQSSNNLATYLKGPRRFQKLANLNQNQLRKLYPRKNQFAYVLGTIDGRIIEQFNQDTLFYGASMPKTMLGLAHLVTFKGDAQITDNELTSMLTYWRRSKPKAGYLNSNVVARGISSRFVGKTKKLNRPGIGRLTPEHIKNVSKHFGIGKSTFQFGGGMNKQTAKDSFLFFAGLARMDQEKFNMGDPLKEFYNQNKNEVKRLIKTQKKRIGYYNKRLAPSGALSRTHWGKGGLWNGSVNFVFVIDNKYVISVFTQIHRALPRNRSSEIHQNNLEGYDLMNAIIYKLLAKIDGK